MTAIDCVDVAHPIDRNPRDKLKNRPKAPPLKIVKGGPPQIQNKRPGHPPPHIQIKGRPSALRVDVKPWAPNSNEAVLFKETFSNRVVRKIRQVGEADAVED